MLRAGVVVVPFLLAACTDPSPAPTPLVASRPEPAGANCAYGGTALESGLDLDDNGTLDAAEVTSTAYACLPAPRELIATAPEPPGANCPAGGMRIQLGRDANDNGVLDADEVTSTSYVCGADGPYPLFAVVPEPPGGHCTYGGQAIEAGYDSDHNGLLDPPEVVELSYACISAVGAQPLVRVDIEPPGPHCSGGGTALDVGLDANGDGVLQTVEVTSTQYLCGQTLPPTVVHGDVYITSSLDLAALDGVTEITGNLICNSSNIDRIEAPTLEHIDGTLDCTRADGPQAATYAFPNLRTAAQINLRGVTALDFSSLESADIFLWEADEALEAPPLTQVVLPAFETGTLTLVAHSTTNVSVPAARMASFDLTSVPALTSFDAPALEAGGLRLTGTHIAAISLPALWSGWFDIYAAPDLTTLSLPAMTEGELYLSGNPSFTTLVAPAVTYLTTLSIGNNPMFPTCAAQQLATQGHAQDVAISGNDDTAICP